MEKPREFELAYSGMSFAWAVRPNSHGKFDDEYVKVIEKSAYDQLLADARELQKALETYTHPNSVDLLVWEDPSEGFIERDVEGNVYGFGFNATKALETFTKKYGSAK